jgi:hypothetical protein
MNPMRLITYTLLIGVATLVAMGGLGFYLGYHAGRGDLTEMKEFVLKSMSPENAAALNDALKQQGGKAVAQEVNLTPVIEGIHSLSAQIGRLEQSASNNNSATPQVIEKIKEDPKLKEELASVTQKLARATEQYNTCTRDLGVMKVKIEAQTAVQPQQPQQPQQPRSGNTQQHAGADPSVVLYDNVLLKRDAQKVYNEVDVSLALQSVASRSARVVVNQQSLSISFGERKIIQHRDVTCELQLMETDLDITQARLNIACKR